MSVIIKALKSLLQRNPKRQCQICNKSINSSKHLIAGTAAFYHDSCFRCACCKKQGSHIVSGPIPKVLCDKHWAEEQPKLSAKRSTFCLGCKQKLLNDTRDDDSDEEEDEGVKKCWHDACFAFYKVYSITISELHSSIPALPSPATPIQIHIFTQRLYLLFEIIDNFEQTLNTQLVNTLSHLSRDGALHVQQKCKDMLSVLSEVSSKINENAEKSELVLEFKDGALRFDEILIWRQKLEGLLVKVHDRLYDVVCWILKETITSTSQSTPDQILSLLTKHTAMKVQNNRRHSYIPLSSPSTTVKCKNYISNNDGFMPFDHVGILSLLNEFGEEDKENVMESFFELPPVPKLVI